MKISKKLKALLLLLVALVAAIIYIRFRFRFRSNIESLTGNDMGPCIECPADSDYPGQNMCCPGTLICKNDSKCYAP
jgi:hypothetical protein